MVKSGNSNKSKLSQYKLSKITELFKNNKTDKELAHYLKISSIAINPYADLNK